MRQSISLLLPLASAVVLGATFTIPSLWFLSLVGLVPLLFFLTRSAKNVRAAFLGGFLFGVVFLGVVLFFLFDMHPLTWAGVPDTRASLTFIFTAWMISVITFSFFTALWAASFYALRHDTPYDIILGASLWVIFEWLRALGFSIISYGDGGLLGPHWTFGNFGYALSGSPLLPLASFGGMYLLSFLVVSCNAALELWAEKRFAVSRRIFFLSIGIFVTLVGINIALSTYYTNLRNTPSLSAAILYTDFPSSFVVSKEESATRKELFRTLLTDIAKEKQKPDIVVFPEDTRFLSSFSPRDRAALLQNVSDGTEMVFIDSARTRIDGKIFSVLSYYDENGNVIGEYKKLLLVPHGEYLPFFTGGLARIFGKGVWTDTFIESRGYARGDAPIVARTEKGNFGGLFCSEILSGALHTALARDGAEIIINAASLSFAHGSPLLVVQTRAETQMRAAETGRFLIRAANSAPAFVVAPNGAIIAESETGTGILYARVARITKQTPYVRIGNWTVLFSLLFVVFTTQRRILNKPQA